MLTIVLTEVEARLVRRRSSMARPVRLLRAFILPVGALLVLLTQVPNAVVSNEGGIVKITATVLGLMVLVFVLSGLNTALFLNASGGVVARPDAVDLHRHRRASSSSASASRCCCPWCGAPTSGASSLRWA